MKIPVQCAWALTRRLKWKSVQTWPNICDHQADDACSGMLIQIETNG